MSLILQCRGCGVELDPLQYSIGFCISCDVARGDCHNEVDDLKLELARVKSECAQLKNDLKRERDGRADVANLLANYKLIARTNDIERDDLQRKHDSIYAGARRDILNLLAELDVALNDGDMEYNLEPESLAVIDDIRERWLSSILALSPSWKC